MRENKRDELFQELRDYLHQNLGLNFNSRQNKELFRKMDQASSSFGFSHTEQFINWILNRPLTNDELFKLASHLTIGETYFMREKKGYDFLEQIYLPGIIHKRLVANRKIKIWCAGCATGEEAYSLAIVLKQSIPLIKDWDISILATDINPVFLDKARIGVYTKWSFRNNNETFKEKYFEKVKVNEYQIIPEIRSMVKFASLNLASDTYPSTSNEIHDFDIIFCRNVLIYFSSEGVRSVTDNLYKSLNDGGVLVVSPVEMSNLISRKFNSIFYSGFTIYHKGKINSENKDSGVKSGKAKVIKRAESNLLKKTEVKPLNNPYKTEIQSLPKPIRLKQIKKVEANTNVETDFEKIEKLFDNGAFAETENLLGDFLKQSSNHNEAATKIMAKTKANLGKLKEAESWCIKCLSINKLDHNLHYLLATIMQEAGNDDKAIAELKISLYLNPDFVLGHFLLGTLLSKNGDTMAGKKAFKNALSCLSKYSSADILPESDGISVERLTAIINSIIV